MEVERCPYGFAPRVYMFRERIDVVITVIDLETGTEVSTRNFQGQQPRACRNTETFQTNSVTGLMMSKTVTGEINAEGFEDWLIGIMTTLPGLTGETATSSVEALSVTLEGHTGLVASVNYSPDGRLVVTASYDDTARIWNATTGEELQQLVGHTHVLYNAEFSPDGETIVTSSRDGTARIWDVETGQELLELTGHTGSVNSAHYSPSGDYIVTASDDQTVRVWDATTGEELRQFIGHTDKVRYADFSPDGNFVISTAANLSVVKIWDVSDLADAP